MTTTKSSHRPPDKRLGNSQTTNLLRATARYFHHILIIGAIRKIVRGGVRVRDGSNHLNSTRTTDVCGTNLKCFSDFCLFFIIIILMTKVLTKKKSNSTKEFAITYFLCHWSSRFTKKHMSYQLSTRKSSYALVFRGPRGNLIKTRLENIAKNKSALW